MGWRVRVSVILLVLTLLGFADIFLHISEIRTNLELFIAFTALALLVISEKFGTLINDILLDKEVEEREKNLRGVFSNIERLPSLLAGHYDVITFPNQAEAIKYCLSALTDEVVEVKNTVLRYGLADSASIFGPQYLQWMGKKRDSIKNNCVWTEIVSGHLNNDDPQMSFIREVDGSSRYSYSRIDDIRSPMMQLTILTYRDSHKEILFGHEFPTIRHGVTFLTKNQ